MIFMKSRYTDLATLYFLQRHLLIWIQTKSAASAESSITSIWMAWEDLNFGHWRVSTFFCFPSFTVTCFSVWFECKDPIRISQRERQLAGRLWHVLGHQVWWLQGQGKVLSNFYPSRSSKQPVSCRHLQPDALPFAAQKQTGRRKWLPMMFQQLGR